MEKKQKDGSLQKEIDHRIKNNLNIISSMLGLQISTLEDGTVCKTTDILRASKLRIDTLAMVHDASFKSEDLINVNFRKYVKQLASLVNIAYKSDIDVEVKSEKIEINLNTMLQLGVIITELLTNSLKYAFFYEKNRNNIAIILTKHEKNCQLIYREKSKKIIDINEIRESKALGIKLIMLTLKQMKAHMRITQNGGLSFTINFYCEKDSKQR